MCLWYLTVGDPSKDYFAVINDRQQPVVIAAYIIRRGGSRGPPSAGGHILPGSTSSGIVGWYLPLWKVADTNLRSLRYDPHTWCSSSISQVTKPGNCSTAYLYSCGDWTMASPKRHECQSSTRYFNISTSWKWNEMNRALGHLCAHIG